MALNRETTTYHTVAANLQRWIQSGDLPPGSPLPSERALCDRLGVSRVNARDALHFLENQGLVYRMNRVGWFVAPEVFIYDPTRTHSLLDEARHHQRRLTTELLTAELMVPPRQVARRLGMSEQPQAFQVMRRRAVDGRWVLLEQCWFRQAAFPELLEQDLSGSLTALVRDRYGYRQRQLEVAISSKPLTNDQAQHLRVREGSAALQLVREVQAGGECIVVEVEYWLHDAIEMRMGGRSAV